MGWGGRWGLEWGVLSSWSFLSLGCLELVGVNHSIHFDISESNFLASGKLFSRESLRQGPLQVHHQHHARLGGDETYIIHVSQPSFPAEGSSFPGLCLLHTSSGVLSHCRVSSSLPTSVLLSPCAHSSLRVSGSLFLGGPVLLFQR